MDNNTNHINPTQQKKNQIKPIHLFIFLIILIAVILIIISVIKSINKLPKTKIDNFNKYYPQMSSDSKETAQITLYNIISNNLPEGEAPPRSGAKIRDGSTTGKYEQSIDIYTDTFIVDIESIQQSYYMHISWSPNKDNPNLDGGYPIYVNCPTEAQLIYPHFNCVDGFGTEAEFNFNSALPIIISYYRNNYSEYIAYSITAKKSTNNQDNIIVITDDTGGNYEAALEKLKEADINPDDYEIEYVDLSSEQLSVPAPNDAEYLYTDVNKY